MTAADDPRWVDASADKALFVSMLVKDIELLPAVIDLVDNSVDGARATTPDDFSAHHIELNVSADRFEIQDDCGGIPLDVARQYAFRFGRPAEHDGVPGSVGQFGIGMKRALFKIGSKFRVESRAASTAFDLPVDVKDWLSDNSSSSWQFTMASVDESYKPETAGRGTKITVTDLHDSVSDDFGNPTVLSQLREQIRLRHQGVLDQGLVITLNGERLRGYLPMLLSGANFKPVSHRFTITTDGGEVNCRIVAGVAASEDDESRDEGEADDFRSAGDAGWWVFCNDRLLLVRDRTFLTGWGDSVAVYHPQYRRFRGYVFLAALDTSLLPWNTTKTSVDQDSRVWRQVQEQMKIALAQVISVLNRLKKERQTSTDPENDAPVTLALAAAKPTKLSAVTDSKTHVVPPLPTAPPRPRPSTKKIQYDVSMDRFKTISAHLGSTNTAHIGRTTFDYYFDAEVED